jgi:hypothetical protein
MRAHQLRCADRIATTRRQRFQLFATECCVRGTDALQRKEFLHERAVDTLAEESRHNMLVEMHKVQR